MGGAGLNQVLLRVEKLPKVPFRQCQCRYAQICTGHARSSARTSGSRSRHAENSANWVGYFFGNCNNKQTQYTFHPAPPRPRFFCVEFVGCVCHGSICHGTDTGQRPGAQIESEYEQSPELAGALSARVLLFRAHHPLARNRPLASPLLSAGRTGCRRVDEPTSVRKFCAAPCASYGPLDRLPALFVSRRS
jgi:hypothetical protein